MAEQVKEVEDCIAATGRRPVQWLLQEMPVDARWCLIHATHMTHEETLGMAKAGAVAGLCPITEANLGDGIFDGERFLSAGGALGVGSDSNVRISVSEELQQLEYSQRLGLKARNVVARTNGSTGRRLFEEALAGGAQALSASCGLMAGRSADFVSLTTRMHLICATTRSSTTGSLRAGLRWTAPGLPDTNWWKRVATGVATR